MPTQTKLVGQKRKTRTSKSRGPKKDSKQLEFDKASAGQSSVLYRPMGGDMWKTTVIYAESIIALNPGLAGLTANWVFSANGLYDPNITGTGHQPRGFDQIMQLYDHYVVLGSKITCHFGNYDASNPQMVGIAIKDSNTVSSNALQEIPELGRCVMRYLAPLNGNSTGKLTLSCNPAKFLGRRDPMSESDLKGSSSANPVEQAFYNIFAQPVAATDTNSVQVQVTIEYFTAFIEPSITPSS